MFSKRSCGRSTPVELPVDRLLPASGQPRKHFDSEELSRLCESIRQNGIIQPLTVRELEDGQYMLISGERRLRAARLAGFSRVPCVVLRAGEQGAAVFALLDNLHHKPLDFFEEADAIYTLISQWGVAREDVASRLGITQAALSSKLRLLSLTRWQRERIKTSHLSERHARALLKIEDNETRDNALLAIIAKGLNVTEAELLAESTTCAMRGEKSEKTGRQRPVIGDSRLIANTVSHAVETMRRAGVNAVSEKKETDGTLEFRIVVKKSELEEQLRVIGL